jgi:hypothetical protein
MLQKTRSGLADRLGTGVFSADVRPGQAAAYQRVILMTDADFVFILVFLSHTGQRSPAAQTHILPNVAAAALLLSSSSATCERPHLDGHVLLVAQPPLYVGKSRQGGGRL